MQSYSVLKYFFPILFFLQYLGCDTYKDLTPNYDTSELATVAVEDDCSGLKKYSFNGFYAPSKEGKLFKKKEGEYFTDSLIVYQIPFIDYTKFKSVSRGYTASGYPNIQVVFTEKGTQLFKDYTAAHIGGKIAVIIKDELIMAPNITSEIPGGQVEISGNFTQSEVNKIHTYLDKMIQCTKDK